MKQIQELTLEKFRLHDCFSHLDMTCELLSLISVEDDQPFCSVLVAATRAFDVVIKQARGNSHTQELKTATEELLDSWRGARAQVKALRRHPLDAKRTAAVKAYALFEKYGEVSIMTQTDMHTTIKNLLQELNLLTEEEQTLLDLKEWIHHLSNAHLDFLAAFLAQSTEYGEREKGIVAERRLAAEQAYYALVFRINAGAGYNGDAPYIEFINRLNGLIEKMDYLYSSIVGHRPKKEDEEAEETTDSTEQTFSTEQTNPDLPVV